MKCKSDYVKDSQRRKKQFAVDMFGGKCQMCGYNKCINALEFHHVEKNHKEEKPSYIIMRWSWKRALEELKKCILICSNCHREIHYTERNVEYEKLMIRPLLDLECENCHTVFQSSQPKSKYCSQICNHIGEKKVKNRPTVEELQKLINSITMVKIGKIYGVSDNAVRKWAKSYNILI